MSSVNKRGDAGCTQGRRARTRRKVYQKSVSTKHTCIWGDWDAVSMKRDCKSFDAKQKEEEKSIITIEKCMCKCHFWYIIQNDSGGKVHAVRTHEVLTVCRETEKYLMKNKGMYLFTCRQKEIRQDAILIHTYSIFSFLFFSSQYEQHLDMMFTH